VPSIVERLVKNFAFVNLAGGDEEPDVAPVELFQFWARAARESVTLSEEAARSSPRKLQF